MSQNLLLAAATEAFPMMGRYFPSGPLPLTLEVTVEEPGRRDDELNHAVNMLIPAALERGQGILVVQVDYGRYTVRIDEHVPCGVTHESRSPQVNA